jgi:hypothetical protein
MVGEIIPESRATSVGIRRLDKKVKPAGQQHFLKPVVKRMSR